MKTIIKIKKIFHLICNKNNGEDKRVEVLPIKENGKVKDIQKIEFDQSRNPYKNKIKEIIWGVN
jgi:hypothetical protein